MSTDRTLLHGRIVDLGTLQYPRHLHKSGGAFLIVSDAEDATQQIEEGWWLTPPSELADESPIVQEAETSTLVTPDPDMPPVAVRKKPGRPRKLKE